MPTRKALITALLLLYFAAAVRMAFALPAHATPNELLNFEYVQVMRQIGGLPNRGLVDSEVRYTEWHQPPRHRPAHKTGRAGQDNFHAAYDSGRITNYELGIGLTQLKGEYREAWRGKRGLRHGRCKFWPRSRKCQIAGGGTPGAGRRSRCDYVGQ